MSDVKLMKLFRDCYDLLTLEYGEKWKYLSKDSKLKKTLIELEKVLEIDNGK